MISSGSTSEVAIGRFSNVEFSRVGQGFREGRNPINFYMNGDMPNSYVKECAIHDSFNRAINILASNYITIERNVVYNIMGNAFVLQGGAETNNVFKNNLAALVKASSGLVTDDLVPGIIKVFIFISFLLDNNYFKY